PRLVLGRQDEHHGRVPGHALFGAPGADPAGGRGAPRHYGEARGPACAKRQRPRHRGGGSRRAGAAPAQIHARSSVGWPGAVLWPRSVVRAAGPRLDPSKRGWSTPRGGFERFRGARWRMTDTVLIIDFGSQVTQLIARRVREHGAYSEIVP